MHEKKLLILSLIVLLIFFIGCTTTNGDNLSDNNDDNFGDSNGPNQFNNLDQFRKVRVGDNVSVHYIGKFEDGNIFDSSIGKDALTFTAGAGQMISGFDKAVIGMMVGENKTITLPPEEAYGEARQELIIIYDKNNIPDFDNWEVGMDIVAGNGTPGKIIAKDQNTLTIDYNSKMAGETLIFDILLVSINN